MENVQVFGQTLILNETLPSGNRRFKSDPSVFPQSIAFYDLTGHTNAFSRQGIPCTWQIRITVGEASVIGFGMTIAEAELDMKARLIQNKIEQETLLAAIDSKPFPESERRSLWERLLDTP